VHDAAAAAAADQGQQHAASAAAAATAVAVAAASAATAYPCRLNIEHAYYLVPLYTRYNSTSENVRSCPAPIGLSALSVFASVVSGDKR